MMGAHAGQRRVGLGRCGAQPCVRACVCVSLHVSVEG